MNTVFKQIVLNILFTLHFFAYLFCLVVLRAGREKDLPSVYSCPGACTSRPGRAGSKALLPALPGGGRLLSPSGTYPTAEAEERRLEPGALIHCAQGLSVTRLFCLREKQKLMQWLSAVYSPVETTTACFHSASFITVLSKLSLTFYFAGAF